MFQALYRKWRPKTFDEIVGQDRITALLKRQSAEGKVSHAYLFTGTRGTGKTTSAKVLAKAVNCEHPIDGNPCNECFACKSIDDGSATDVLEIDAASNNRVDDVRELIDEVVYPPTLLKKRVYIIDEVHMLTDSAFNALLKTLEEPPEYVLFILATTELNELPATIISRCMRFDFSRVEPDVLASRARFICESEGIKITDEALMLISKLADGSVRDCLSLLDACASSDRSEEISISDVRSQLGISDNDVLILLFAAIRSHDVATALTRLKDVHIGSSDPSIFLEDMITFVRDCIIAKSSQKREQYLRERFFFSTQAFEKIPPLLSSLTIETLLYYSSVLEESLASFSKYTVNKKTLLDMAVIKMCDPSMAYTAKAITARLSEIERKLSVLLAGGTVEIESKKPILDLQPNESEKEAEADKAQDGNKKPFMGNAEIRQLLESEPSLQAVLLKCKMYICGNVFLIEGPSFNIKRLQVEKYYNMLREAVTSVVGPDYKIEMAVASAAAASDDPFDELKLEEQ